MAFDTYIKRVLKSAARPALRLYSGSPDLRVDNDPKRVAVGESYSQFGQDCFVFNEIFKGRKNGYFVDVGGSHPTKMNNTYLLEINGWEGIAFEPQEHLRSLWPTKRRARCLHHVIGATNSTVVFFEGERGENGLSGVDGYNKCSQGYKKIEMEQRSLESIFDEYGIKKVDYLSIDVEGYEMNVLRGIDFSRVEIRLIGVENDSGFGCLPVIGGALGRQLGDNRLRAFLRQKGYRFVARVFCDDFFLKEDRDNRRGTLPDFP